MTAQHYPVPLVGEQYYQLAIGRCHVGDTIDVCIEVGNPFDAEAIVARRRDGGETIGYIARDSFVQRLIHDEENSIAAAVKAIGVGERGFRQVVLLASIVDAPAETVRYRAGEASEPPARTSMPPRPAADEDEPVGLKITPLQIGIGVAILIVLVRCMT